MAIVYYPSSSFMFRRDTISSSFEQVVLSTQPNTILYFGSGSELNELSASTILKLPLSKSTTRIGETKSNEKLLVSSVTNSTETLLTGISVKFSVLRGACAIALLTS